MARSYDMRRRGRAALETRRRIIDAAHSLLDRPDGGSLSLSDVADAAGVTRATIHKRIGSRRELLQAVFRDQGRRVDFDRVLAALELEDPVVAVIQTVRESCRAWSVSPRGIRRTLALAALDPEVGRLVEGYERDRRERLAGLIDRLVDSGRASRSAGRGEAVSILALATSFQAYDFLTMDATPEHAEEVLVRQVQEGLGLD